MSGNDHCTSGRERSKEAITDPSPRGPSWGMLADYWREQASENVENWGTQHPETLLVAITEEVGEISKAYLEATYEGGDPSDVHAEIDDLAALLIQLTEALDLWSGGHPGAFEPLPTAEEVDQDGGFG